MKDNQMTEAEKFRYAAEQFIRRYEMYKPRWGEKEAIESALQMFDYQMKEGFERIKLREKFQDAVTKKIASMNPNIQTKVEYWMRHFDMLASDWNEEKAYLYLIKLLDF